MKIIVHPKYQFATNFISCIPNEFENNKDLIYSGRNTVKRFRSNYGTWIVKKYRKPNIIQQLAYTFWRKSKAERAFIFANKLLDLGIDTPEGIAYIENKKNGLFNIGYFISTASDDLPLYPILVENSHFDKSLATSLAAFFVFMHNKGFLHGDPNLDNILYHVNSQGENSFSVIDTNRSVFRTHPSPKECLDNLKRITHRRDLLAYIIKEYAIMRQWNIDESIHQVMHALNKFEKKRQLKHLLKFN